MASIAEKAVYDYESVREGIQVAINKTPRASGAAVVHTVVGQLGAAAGLTVRSTIAVWHALLGGLYVFITLQVIARLKLHVTSQIWIVVLLYTAGAMMLFFGYTEVYTLPYLLATVIALTSHKYLDGGGSLVIPIVMTIIAVVVNIQAALLLASLCFLLWRRRNIGSHTTRRIAIAIIVATIAAGIGLQFAIDLSEYYRPFFGGKAERAVFSVHHLVSIVNEVALLCPSIIVLIAIGCMGINRRESGEAKNMTAEHRYLAIVAVVPFLLFLGFFKPGLGLSRDWDIFASMTPFLILAFLPALERVRSEIRTWIVPVMFLGILQTGAWIAVNANASRVEARYKDTLINDPPHGGYDYEILAEYYLRQQRHEDALEVLRSAYDVERNPRYAFNAGIKAAELGRLDEAIDWMSKCIRTVPTYSTARAKLATYLVAKRDFNSVIEVTRQGLELEPDNIYFNVLLGMALFETKQYDAAYPQLRRSLELDIPPEMRSDVARAAALIEQAMRASEQNQQ